MSIIKLVSTLDRKMSGRDLHDPLFRFLPRDSRTILQHW